MNEQLIKMITERTGISEEQAKVAAETVISFLKDRLPEPMAGQVDGLLKGDVSQLGGLMGSLGGMFGKKE